MPSVEIKTCLLLLWLIGGLAFFPALDNEFTNWDDQQYITENIVVQNLTVENIKLIFTTFQVYFYHPLTLLSFSVEHAIVGLKPTLFHANNVILHLFNASLAFLLLRRLSCNPKVAFMAALLFAVHPLRVESVAWISGRKDVLATLFYLSALVTYSVGTNGRSWSRLSCSFILALCGFVSKPSFLLFPFILLLIDYLQKRPWSFHLLTEKSPFFLLSLSFGFLAIQAQQTFGAIDAVPALQGIQQILFPAYILVFYLYKFVWPTPLTLVYQYPDLSPDHVPWWLAGSALCTFCFLILIIWAWQRNHRLTVFGSLWFLLAILPNLQLVPVGETMAFDRYTYIPGLGLFLIFSLAVIGLHRKIAEKILLQRILSAAIMVVVVLLVLKTRSQCDVWHNSVSLYDEIMRTNPKVGVAFLVNRGKALLGQGDFELAISDFQQYLQVFPSGALTSFAHEGLGVAFGRAGKHAQAEEEFSRALQAPGSDKAAILMSRGKTLVNLGRANEAIKDFSQALDITPKVSDLWFNRALAWEQLGQSKEALADYSEAVRVNPSMMKAWKNRGGLHQKLGSGSQALFDFQEALRLAPDHAPNWYNIGIWKEQNNQTAEAAENFREALQRDPQLFPALQARIKCLIHLKREQEAFEELQQSFFSHQSDLLRLAFLLHHRSGNFLAARDIAQKIRVASPTAEALKELSDAGF